MDNYIKVTRYSPRPAGGRRSVAEQQFFFFDTADDRAAEHARFMARALFERWDAVAEATGCKVVPSMFHADDKVATLRDWIRPIAIHECERPNCGMAAVRGPYCLHHFTERRQRATTVPSTYEPERAP